MFVVNVLGLFASGLAGIGFGVGFWCVSFPLLSKRIFNLIQGLILIQLMKLFCQVVQSHSHLPSLPLSSVPLCDFPG